VKKTKKKKKVKSARKTAKKKIVRKKAKKSTRKTKGKKKVTGKLKARVSKVKTKIKARKASIKSKLKVATNEIKEGLHEMKSQVQGAVVGIGETASRVQEKGIEPLFDELSDMADDVIQEAREIASTGVEVASDTWEDWKTEATSGLIKTEEQ